jgi:hypothetical protein
MASGGSIPGEIALNVRARARAHGERRDDEIDRGGRGVHGAKDGDRHPHNWQVEQPVAHAV